MSRRERFRLNHLSKEQLNTLRTKLTTEKRELEQQLEANRNFGFTDSLREGTGELSAYDNHPADLGSEVFERGKDLALAENAQHQLDDVLRALSDMDSGRYGICKASGEPIPYDRLEAMPTAEYTLAHTPDKIHSERPVEESFLYPPFGRTSLDERRDETEFDGEDAWQIVEEWGTSNTPAMSENPQVESYEEMEIESDENTGYVEALESFLATDIYGRHVTVVRNKQYTEYMHSEEGDPLLEEDLRYTDGDGT
jgi:YteA family regulatory protein